MKQILGLMLLVISSLGHAVQISNLYTSVVRLPASLSDRELLQQAFTHSIDKVLFRVSGQQDTITPDVLQAAHKEAASWVAQHSVVMTDQMAEVEGESQLLKQVTVTFYKESINDFLFSQGLPVWGSDRPSTLVWMVEDGDSGRQMYGSNSSSASLSSFFNDAKELGFPVYAPLADRVDTTKLQTGAIWGFFQEDISDASQRYDTDVVMALRIGRYNSEYVVDSMLIYPDESIRLRSVSDVSKFEALKKVLAISMANMSNRYASVRTSDAPRELIVRIDGVTGYQRLSVVKDYLQSIDVVRDVYVQQIEAESAQFSLALDGTVEKFKNSVALSSVLRAKQAPVFTSNNSAIELYEFKGKGTN